MNQRFSDRREAGRLLAGRLEHYGGRDGLLVLALPRGGVPVAFEVARRLRAPLDVFIVRKLGVPWHSELAMGAIAAGGVRVLNDELLARLDLSDADIERVAASELQELERRAMAYRGTRPPLEVDGKTVIVVDDGLATGATMRAAVAALRRMGPERIVVAIPVGAADSCRQIEADADEVVCLSTPDPFQAVGLWYGDFPQTSDDEVRDLLEEAESFGRQP